MAEPESNPAQHLQWQRCQHPALDRPQLQQQPSKCRHVHNECSWGHGWSRVAWLLAAVCLLTRPVMPEVIYRVDPLGKCFVLFSFFAFPFYFVHISATSTCRNSRRFCVLSAAITVRYRSDHSAPPAGMLWRFLANARQMQAPSYPTHTASSLLDELIWRFPATRYTYIYIFIVEYI